jgi:transposase-like protein
MVCNNHEDEEKRKNVAAVLDRLKERVQEIARQHGWVYLHSRVGPQTGAKLFSQQII